MDFIFYTLYLILYTGGSRGAALRLILYTLYFTGGSRRAALRLILYTLYFTGGSRGAALRRHKLVPRRARPLAVLAPIPSPSSRPSPHRVTNAATVPVGRVQLLRAALGRARLQHDHHDQHLPSEHQLWYILILH